MSAARLPVTAPRNQQANQYNGSALLITWEPPLLSGEEGPILGYRIIYWRRNLECLGIESDIERFEQGQRRTLYGSDLTSGFIIGLEQDIYYCVAVQAFNTAGDGPPSGFAEQTTYKLWPQSFPTIVQLNSTNYPRTVRVNWKGVQTTLDEEAILGYRIRYWLVGANYKEAHTDVDVRMRTYGYVQNLEINKRYNLRVYAYSRAGVGKMSSPIVQFQMIPKDQCVPGASWDRINILSIRIDETDKYDTLDNMSQSSKKDLIILPDTETSDPTARTADPTRVLDPLKSCRTVRSSFKISSIGTRLNVVVAMFLETTAVVHNYTTDVFILVMLSICHRDVQGMELIPEVTFDEFDFWPKFDRVDV
nr:contactin,neuroglian,septate junction protein [Hymenolepis microstoma]